MPCLAKLVDVPIDCTETHLHHAGDTATPHAIFPPMDDPLSQVDGIALQFRAFFGVLIRLNNTSIYLKTAVKLRGIEGNDGVKMLENLTVPRLNPAQTVIAFSRTDGRGVFLYAVR
jgi:hypothetical protein